MRQLEEAQLNLRTAKEHGQHQPNSNYGRNFDYDDDQYESQQRRLFAGLRQDELSQDSNIRCPPRVNPSGQTRKREDSCIDLSLQMWGPGVYQHEHVCPYEEFELTPDETVTVGSQTITLVNQLGTPVKVEQELHTQKIWALALEPKEARINQKQS
ncbi:uncharacterized protein LOC125177785 [Hyalella azteca]|uniref:Uncharacterized protein LOC125177785 n=1 Tax=Hyalella azteca TaxID=294128 RepID=A0A979FGS4_HYAAZ|nr:uncharacterized protein LOC125177785 [Hyalella azteca]